MGVPYDKVDGVFFQELKHPVEFLLVRHGESEGNANGVFQGLLEYPLTDRGRDQARIRGRQLKTLPFCVDPPRVRLYTSPMGRARETAELIAESAGFVTPTVVPSLKELDTGVWTGKTWADVQSNDTDLWPHFRSKSWAAIPEAESESALYERALESWTFLRDQAVEHNLNAVIAVTHAGFLQWLFRLTFGCRTWFPLIPVHNCGMFRFKVEPIRHHAAYVAWETIDEPLTVEPLPASL